MGGTGSLGFFIHVLFYHGAQGDQDAGNLHCGNSIRRWSTLLDKKAGFVINTRLHLLLLIFLVTRLMALQA